MSALAATYKFTVEEFYRLYEVGLFHSKDRVELLNGEIIIMQAIGSRHAQAVSNFNAYLGEQARRRFKVSPQNPVELERYSMPQPDLTLIPWSWGNARRHPTPEEVFLIIEVADSSLAYDREEKRRAYAATGIREFWLLNLVDDVLEIYRQPEANAHREQLVIPADGSATPLAFPDVTIAIADILPPR